MTVKHVLFIVTNAAEIGPRKRRTGFFFPEIAHPFEALDKAGIAIEFASPKGGVAPHDAYDEKDPAQRAFMESKAFKRLSRSRKLSEVDASDYDAIFVPGGLGPMVDIQHNPDVQRAVLQAWNTGKLVSAVCHGPCAFLGVKLEDGSAFVKGKRLTSFSKSEESNYAREDVPFELEDALRAEGAEYSSTTDWQSKVVVDGRLLTGQNPASAGALGKELVAALNKAG